MLRLLLLPVRLVWFPFRVAAGSAKAGWYAGRAVGISRATFFGVGFATGVLAASPKARRAALAGTRRAMASVAKARDDAAPPEPVVTPAVEMTAPHGVVVAAPLTSDPSRPVPPTD